MKLTNAQMDAYLSVLRMQKEKKDLGWAIAKNIHILTDAAKEYLDLKQELVEKYGKEMGNSGKVINRRTDPEGYEAFMTEMGGVPDIEQDVNVYQVDVATFRSGELTSNAMADLFWMVKEG